MKRNNNKKKKSKSAPGRRVVKRDVNPYVANNRSTTIPKPEPTEADKLTDGSRPNLIKFGSREYIMDIIGLEGLGKVVDKVYSQALKGSFKHQELLMNYLMGKPIERLKLDAYVEKGMTQPVQPVFQIIADHARLNKLAKDIEPEPDEMVDADRIKLMEEMLNSAREGKVISIADEDEGPEN